MKNNPQLMSTKMSTYTMTINGKAVTSDKQIPVINPATEEVIANCPDASIEQVEQAVTAAAKAFIDGAQSWGLDEDKRRQCLQACAQIIINNKTELARLLTQEQGKPLASAESEVEYAAEQFTYAANLQIPVDVLQDDAEIKVAVYRRPIGVAAIITPWNYPLSISCNMAIPLLLGNTVIVKPSPFTPLTTLKLGELIRDIFPAGVMNIISGGDHVGAALTKHPKVGVIGFTGSVATGKAIAKVAAEDLKRVTLELGGNDPAIVLPDADPKKIADKIFWGAFTNSGQVCTAIKRLYIHETIFQPLVDKLIQLAEKVKVGNGLEEGIELGPLNNKPQLDIITDFVADAKKQKAEVLTGGDAISGPGYFYQPTLITNISEEAKLVSQEQFGPALPIMKFSDTEEVIKRANNTKMGLGASVWSEDLGQAEKVASRLQAGVAWINRNFTTHPDAPFGGFKQSGLGREGGLWSVASFSEIQTMSIKKI